jgi:sterol 14-demethylase
MQAAMAAHGGNGANGHGAPAAATKRLKIVLDRDLCQGHAVCVGEAPSVFGIAADGKVECKHAGELPFAVYGQVHAAEKYCPTRAIKLRYE